MAYDLSWFCSCLAVKTCIGLVMSEANPCVLLDYPPLVGGGSSMVTYTSNATVTVMRQSGHNTSKHILFISVVINIPVDWGFQF